MSGLTERRAHDELRCNFASLLVLAILLAATTMAHGATFPVKCSGTADDVRDLIAAFESANDQQSFPGPNSIVLAAGCTYSFSAVNNWWYGPNALPPITSEIVSEGNGATLSVAQIGVTRLRFFYVSGGFSGLPLGSLTLKNLTLRNGKAVGGSSQYGGGGAGMGGAIFNQGVLSLVGTTFTNNQAIGGGQAGWLGPGGGGMGADAPGNDGGGFGGAVGPYGGMGGSGLYGPSGGGGGFASGADGADGTDSVGGEGGGNSGWGGEGSGPPGNPGGGGGDGGGGAYGSIALRGSSGGSFGQGGGDTGLPGMPGGAGAGGGVGGGGGGGAAGGGGGGFGGGAGAGSFVATGGFGGGGGGNTALGIPGQGGYGGGGFALGGFVTFWGGGGAGMGGAIFNHGGALTIVDSTLTTNTAQGGMAAPRQGDADGAGLGGAIFNLQGTVTIIQSTLTLNSAIDTNGIVGPAGGAVYNVAYLQGDDGGVFDHESLVVLSNSVLSGSTNGYTPVSDLAGDQPETLINGAANIATAATSVDATSIVEASISLGMSTISGIRCSSICPAPAARTSEPHAIRPAFRPRIGHANSAIQMQERNGAPRVEPSRIRIGRPDLKP